MERDKLKSHIVKMLDAMNDRNLYIIYRFIMRLFLKNRSISVWKKFIRNK